MSIRHFYNENDPYAAQWIRNLIKAGHLPDGEVDERSIELVQPDDLRGFRQVHLFCGIAGWPLALKIARFPEDKEIWTGSCPCQPFSGAGKRKGTSDKRHLWPHMARLVLARRPAIVLGEQVDKQAGYDWLDGVRSDLEAEAFEVRAVDIPAASVNSPHKRNRIYWCARRLSDSRLDQQRGRSPLEIERGDRSLSAGHSGGQAPQADRIGGYGCIDGDGGLPDSEHAPRRAEHEQDAGERQDCEPRDGTVLGEGGGAIGPDSVQDSVSVGCAPRRASEPRSPGGRALAHDGGDDAQQLGFAFSKGPQGHAGDGDVGRESGRQRERPDGPTAQAGGRSRVCLADTRHGLVSEPRRGPEGRDGTGPAGALSGADGGIADGLAVSPCGGLWVLREPSRRDGQPDRRDPGSFWADYAIIGPDPKGKYRRVGRRLQGIEEILGSVEPDVRVLVAGLSEGVAGVRSGEETAAEIQGTEGWGTPRATNNGGVPTEFTGKGSRLEDQAADLHGRSSPTAVDGSRGGLAARPHDTGVPLSQMVVTASQLATGPTADASAVQDRESSETWLARRDKLKQKGTNGNGCGTPLSMAVRPELSGSRAGDHLPLLEVGVPARVGKLKGFGNAIVPSLAALVVMAVMEDEAFATAPQPVVCCDTDERHRDDRDPALCHLP